MSMIGIFPWLEIASPLEIDGFRIVGYHRGSLPFGAGSDGQRIADLMLEPFIDSQGRSISLAAVVTWEGEQFRDLTDEEGMALLDLSRVFAFAALSSREYFAGHSSYWAQDNLLFFLQRFSDPAGSASVVTRRRDGHSMAIWSRTTYKRHRPIHVQAARVSVDEPLLRSLWTLRTQSGDWDHYLEAIDGFNRANTDGDGISELEEAVTLVGAFERLFDLRRGKGEELRDAVAEMAKGFEVLDCHECLRIKVPRAGQSPILRWLDDFFVSRGSWAHGRSDPTHPNLWDRREHLLLGSYVFPLILKAKLASEGRYTLTGKDRESICILNRLACLPEIFVDPQAADFERFPWRAVMAEGMIHSLARSLVWEMDGEPEPTDAPPYNDTL